MCSPTWCSSIATDRLHRSMIREQRTWNYGASRAARRGRALSPSKTPGLRAQHLLLMATVSVSPARRGAYTSIADLFVAVSAIVPASTRTA